MQLIQEKNDSGNFALFALQLLLFGCSRIVCKFVHYAQDSLHNSKGYSSEWYLIFSFRLVIISKQPNYNTENSYVIFFSYIDRRIAFIASYYCCNCFALGNNYIRSGRPDGMRNASLRREIDMCTGYIYFSKKTQL